MVAAGVPPGFEQNAMIDLLLMVAGFFSKRRAQPNARARTGEWGEELSSRHLKKQGYEIIERRARPSRRGEIDIIATRDGTLVFVEVKTRASEQYGAPLSAVDRNKRRALNKAAIRYLQKAKWPKLAYRFDVVEVVGSPLSKTPPVIRHIENAFPFERRWLMPFH